MSYCESNRPQRDMPRRCRSSNQINDPNRIGFDQELREDASRVENVALNRQDMSLRIDICS